MFVLDLAPPGFSNRIKRLVKAPKRYLVDPALAAAVLGLGRDAILSRSFVAQHPPQGTPHQSAAYFKTQKWNHSCAILPRVHSARSFVCITAGLTY
jgi:hypothetical protein